MLVVDPYKTVIMYALVGEDHQSKKERFLGKVAVLGCGNSLQEKRCWGESIMRLLSVAIPALDGEME